MTFLFLSQGNFSYFWIKKDYSLFRLLRMMFRLNFLVVMVMAVTNHEFVRYYVCAMHTYWFLTVYVMMAIFKSHNEVKLKNTGLFFFTINALRKRAVVLFRAEKQSQTSTVANKKHQTARRLSFHIICSRNFGLHPGGRTAIYGQYRYVPL